MAKSLVRNDGQKAELWFRVMDLNGDPNKVEWRALSQPTPFQDDATPGLNHDAVGGSYGDPGRDLTDGTGETDDELGAGVADDGSLGGLLAKAKAEAESRESVGAGEYIPWMDLRLYVEWLTNSTYQVSVRTFSYGQKRLDSDPACCMDYVGGTPGEFKEGYVLDADDLGLEATEGDVAWFIKNKVLDPIKAAEAI